MTTLGISLIAGLVLFGLRAAALSLHGAPGSRGLLTALFLPIALVAGALVALSLGAAPAPTLLRLAPLAAGILVAGFTRQIGYGLLAGLVVAASTSA